MYIAIFATLVASFTLCAWFFLRPGGVVQTILQLKDERSESRLSSITSNAQKLHETEQKLITIALSLQEMEGMVHRRLTALETRKGRANKKEEREREREDALKLIDASLQVNSNKEVDYVAE